MVGVTMREEFIKAATQEEAERLAPWAEAFFPVDGGYTAYEFLDNGVEIIAEARISPRAKLPPEILAVFGRRSPAG